MNLKLLVLLNLSLVLCEVGIVGMDGLENLATKVGKSFENTFISAKRPIIFSENFKEIT